MRRLVVLLVGSGAALGLAGCGNASLTVKVASPAASVVVTSDSDAIAKLKPKVQQQAQTAGETVVDGDQHSGNRVCGFSASKNGHSYQVDVYGNTSKDTCNSAAQQQFTSVVP